MAMAHGFLERDPLIALPFPLSLIFCIPPPFSCKKAPLYTEELSSTITFAGRERCS